MAILPLEIPTELSCADGYYITTLNITKKMLYKLRYTKGYMPATWLYGI